MNLFNLNIVWHQVIAPVSLQEYYVAFHMYHPILHVSMTLGCHVQNHILVFDQLEYSNNTQAEIEKVNIAKEFLNRFNSLK